MFARQHVTRCVQPHDERAGRHFLNHGLCRCHLSLYVQVGNCIFIAANFTNCNAPVATGWIFGLTTDLSTSGQTRDEVIGASEALTALANQRRDQLQALK